MQDIWNFFETYSYWFDESIYSLLNRDDRRISNQSIIYLLQHDVWGNSAVYGAYLIEELKDSVDISYWRRDKRIKTYTLPLSNQKDIEQWICNDAVRQITDQFTYLWKKIELEIQTCISERYHKKEQKIESPQYLIDQFNVCKNQLISSKEACLLLLGRIAEHWLIYTLKYIRKPKFEYLTGIACSINIIDDHEKKMFDTIATHYNRLKHWIDYDVNDCLLKELIEIFGIFLNNH